MQFKRYRHFFLVVAGICAAVIFLGVQDTKAQHRVTALSGADYGEIMNLYSAYSFALDTGNGAGRIATFTPDGTFSWPGSHHVPQTMDIVKKRTDNYIHRTRPGYGRHNMLTINIKLAADGTVDGFCYALFPESQTPDANGNFKVKPGFYKDKIVKTANGWRFKTREVWYDAKDDIETPNGEIKD